MTEPHFSYEVDKVSAQEWSALLACFDDSNVYQTWAFGSVQWGERNLSHIVLKRGVDSQAIAQLRIVRPFGMRPGIAYLRWGPLFHRRGDQPQFPALSAIADAIYEEYVCRRGLYLEVRPNAFRSTIRAQAVDECFSMFRNDPAVSNERYRTLILDLEPSLEKLRQNLDKKWRNQLNGAERLPLQIEHGVERYQSFADLYQQMKERKRFRSTVNIQKFGEICRALPEDGQVLLLTCYYLQELIAGVVATVHGNSAIFLLGATNETGLKMKAAYLLQWHLITLLKSRGIRYYDLGGIDPEGNAGVYHFKKGLSGTEMSHVSPLAACINPLSLSMVAAFRCFRNGLWTLQKGRGLQYHPR